MGFIETNGLRYFQFDIFNDRDIFHAVLTRHGGASVGPFASLNTGGTVGDDPQAVLRNHEKIYQTLGYDYYSRFDVWQVHGTEILCADGPRSPETPHPKADGILTDREDVTLFMRFADCVPVLLMDPVRRVIGIIHAGWQGTAKQIARVAVEKMQTCYSSRPGDLLAGIGPSICRECYEVGPEVVQSFKRTFGDRAETYFSPGENGHAYLDLWSANRDTLRMAGVEQIEVSGLCTAHNLDDWYSHRAEHGWTGRFGVLMTLGKA
jgi:YfiH family protein